MNLPALCALAALLELDGVHVGQFGFSRPIVLGPLFGTLCGAPAAGTAAGALIELFCVDVLPVGSAMPINGSLALVSFVLLTAGTLVPPAAAFPAALLLGSLFRRVDARVRLARAVLTARAEAAGGARPPFGRLILGSLGLHAAATALFLYAGVTALGPALRWGWEASPMAVRQGLEMAFGSAPWLGISALLYSLRPKW